MLVFFHFFSCCCTHFLRFFTRVCYNYVRVYVLRSGTSKYPWMRSRIHATSMQCSSRNKWPMLPNGKASPAASMHRVMEGKWPGWFTCCWLGKWRAIYSFGGQISDTPPTGLALPKGESLIQASAASYGIITRFKNGVVCSTTPPRALVLAAPKGVQSVRLA